MPKKVLEQIKFSMQIEGSHMEALMEVVKSSKVQLLPKRYAVVKVEKLEFLDSHFLASKDDTETTVITTEERLTTLKTLSEEKWFRLIEVAVSRPFNAPGFLAKITQCIAELGISIFVVSTFSKDYILLKEQDAEAGLQALADVGFPIVSSKRN